MSARDWVLLVAMVFTAAAALGADDLAPHPKYSPADVVRIQLQALRNNGADDAGIALAFRFASPANRAQTGPIERFARMIKLGPYALMLNYRQAIYEGVEIKGQQAQQRVLLLGAQHSVRYDFFLRLQTQPPYQNCWMTEGVGVVATPGGSLAFHQRDWVRLPSTDFSANTNHSYLHYLFSTR